MHGTKQIVTRSARPSILHAVVLASCGPEHSVETLAETSGPGSLSSASNFLKIQVTTQNQRNKCEPAWNGGGAHTHTFQTLPGNRPQCYEKHSSSKQESMSLSKSNAGLSPDIDYCIRPAN